MSNLKLITKQFIDSNYHKLKLSKRFVGTDEIIEIKSENNLDEKMLFNLIDDANDEFLNTQKPIVFKKFKSILSSYNKFINKKMRSDIWSKFYTDYYDYYNEMNFDDYINEKNKHYVALKIRKIRKKYDSLLFDGYIDEYKKNCLIQKLKEDNFDFNDGLNINKLIKVLNKKYVQKKSDTILKEINLFLSNQKKIINDEIRLELILKYNKTDFKFYDNLNIDNLIIKWNNTKILEEINLFLSSYDDLITEDMYSKIKLKYNFHFHKFYDELNLENLLNEHNNMNKSNIIKRELTSSECCIPDSKRLQLNSKYGNVINWNNIIKDYNKAYENKKAFVYSKSFMYQHFKDKITLNKTSNGVFYLHEYYKDKFRKDYEEEKGISDRINKYKEGNNSAINFFTNELIEAIVNISKYWINDNIKYLALISIPPASNKENSSSSMRKTICSIKRYFDNGSLLRDYGFNQEIYDYGNLLYRYIKIKPAKFCKFDERPDAEKHVKTILCTKKNFARDDIAYILMDDITTLGSIMNGCEKILIDKGVKKENIYKLAIANTPKVF